ncbi:TetR/AcrR family transcriptional regulator [Microlunatus speluncae]|uniref:TetR/AcrR family transcriptional regulator n=1 Tax=Microlunatus speluncae TaxID=2594267 RepID=UPI001C2D98C6|nr:TetR/AcrR family transcriptional regulator [Microlunatus speluncae]
MTERKSRTATESKPRLTADDWAEAALEVMAAGGLDAVAVEPLAQRLGTTKGSFYWHFANRKALLVAALEAWERLHTAAVITAVEAEAEPAQRLRRLFRLVLLDSREDRIEIALLASARDPLVAPVMQRVTRARVGYVAEQYRALGCPDEEAEQRALLAVGVYLGHLQLEHAAPGILPAEEGAWQRHLARVETALGLDRTSGGGEQ